MTKDTLRLSNLPSRKRGSKVPTQFLAFARTRLITLTGLTLAGLILTGLPLTGCSSYETHFDCSPGQGVGCRSVSEVDAMVEDGLLGNTEPNEEKPLRVWFAPYEDRFGNLHSETIVYLNPEED